MNNSNQNLPEGFTPLGPGKQFRVLPFFLLMFISWALWIPAGARKAGVLPFPFPSELAWLGVFAPFLFGTYFIHKYGGARAVATHFGRFVKFNFPARYWFFAALAVPSIGLLTTVAYSLAVEPILADGIARFTGGEVKAALIAKYNQNNYESLGLFDGLYAAMAAAPLAYALGSAFLLFVDGGISEEPGWRGFAFPILLDRWGALPAALVIGFVWAAWHMGPLQWEILFRDGADAFFAFLPGYGILYLVGVAPLAIIFSWLYENTGGSLLACFVIHASFNWTSTTLSFTFPGQPLILGVIAFLWLTVIWIIYRNGWKSFARGKKNAD